MACPPVGPSTSRLYFTPSNDSDNISRLPSELIKKCILSGLEIAALCRLACTCRRWNQLTSSDDVWKPIGERVGILTNVKLNITLLQLELSFELKHLLPIIFKGRPVAQIVKDIQEYSVRQVYLNPKSRARFEELRKKKFETLQAEYLEATAKFPSFAEVISIYAFRAELHQDHACFPPEIIGEALRRDNLVPGVQSCIMQIVNRAKTNILTKRFVRANSNQFYTDKRAVAEDFRHRGITISQNLISRLDHDGFQGNFDRPLALISMYAAKPKSILLFMLVEQIRRSPSKLLAFEKRAVELLPEALPMIEDAKMEPSPRDEIYKTCIMMMLRQENTEGLRFFKEDIYPMLMNECRYDEKSSQRFLEKLKIYHPTLYPMVQAWIYSPQLN